MTNPARAASFDAVAAAYDLGRPGYPDAVVEDAIRLAGLPPGGAILEIGFGTGQATRPFAAKGFRMTCLEPGANLAELARRNLSACPDVTVLTQRFEDWPLETGAFDAVLAATSIHHVAEGQRYARPARALKPGGSLIVMGNHPGDEEPGFRKEIDECYARWWGAASSREYAKWTLERRINWVRDDIAKSGYFAAPVVRHHLWTDPYDVARYMAWLDSDSGRLQHPSEVQEGLKRDIAAVIQRRGGTVHRGIATILAVARRE